MTYMTKESIEKQMAFDEGAREWRNKYYSLASQRRFQAACAAMTGVISALQILRLEGEPLSGEHEAAKVAVVYADALIAELAKERE